jgi:hypothetical protein
MLFKQNHLAQDCTTRGMFFTFQAMMPHASTQGIASMSQDHSLDAVIETIASISRLSRDEIRNQIDAAIAEFDGLITDVEAALTVANKLGFSPLAGRPRSEGALPRLPSDDTDEGVQERRDEEAEDEEKKQQMMIAASFVEVESENEGEGTHTSEPYQKAEEDGIRVEKDKELNDDGTKIAISSERGRSIVDDHGETDGFTGGDGDEDRDDE